MKREFVMKGFTLDHNFKVAGSKLSEKYDGMRCLWMPWTRGVKVPWNEKIGPGLWSSYGNPIFAPNWFVEKLPQIPLDGELWAGRQNFRIVSSACRKHEPIDEEWRQISYHLIDTPGYLQLFRPGRVKNAHFDHTFDASYINKFGSQEPKLLYPKRLNDNLVRLRELELPEHVKVMEQIQLSFSAPEAKIELQEHFDRIIGLGGEGVILRQPYSEWKPEKSREIAKVKPEEDMEGTICGFKDGEGKYTGMVGSLELKLENGKTIFLSGMTDEARMPGYFKIGEIITFKYTEIVDGVPRFGRFLRRFQA
jgi:DNA ligase-1